MISPTIMQNLNSSKQTALIAYLKNTDLTTRKKIEQQLDTIDWHIFSQKNVNQNTLSNIAPMPITTQSSIKSKYTYYKNLGLNHMKEGKLALVLLAGGQGSRLGCSGPKGTFNVGITHNLYIFELLIKNTLNVISQIGCMIPFCIMTSELNDKETRSFFKDHNFFGYDPDYIRFFIQESNPVTDLNGQILLKSPDEILKSPNGNGGWFQSMYNSHILDDPIFCNTQWVNVFSVDNVLQGIADPVFLGATIDNECCCGSKVVKKSYPDEKVGAICTSNGKPYIIEYYELDKLKQQGKIINPDLFNYGVTLNYLFQLSKLKETLSSDMPIHKVKKNVPRFYKNNLRITSSVENAYKYETLALDLIYKFDNCLAFEINRDKEFAPIKNKIGKDSIESARILLEKNGWVL